MSGGVSDVALEWHLRFNHFPPVSPVFVATAQQAIAQARAGKWGAVLQLPNGETKTAGEVVEDLHLEGFVEG